MPTLVLNTNTWVTRAEADSYLDERANATAWEPLDNDTKDRCLISAFRWINRVYTGMPAVATTNMKYAQIELAWYIYTFGESHRKHDALNAQGVEDFDVSKFSESLSGRTKLPAPVEDLLEDYDLTSGGRFPLIEREVDDNE